MSSRPSGMSLTRRQWAALIAATPAAAQVSQKTPPQGAPAPAAPADSPEPKLQKANADVRQVSDTLSKIEVPMNVEPAFSFHV